MKTADRIQATALRLFNESGAPNISTNHIAEEMEISPGNLYYHFRNKDAIIHCLFDQFEQRMQDILVAPTERVPDMEDMWFYLHIIFETIWEYRFIYRDMNNLLGRDRRLRRRFRRILQRKTNTAIAICNGLVEAGIMRASPAEIHVLGDTITLVATFWLSYQNSLEDTVEPRIERGVYQVISLVTPFMRGEDRGLLQQLSKAYLR